MSSVVQKLTERKLIQPPRWLPHNTVYECIMGSVAYGVNDPGVSDFDVYGICIPRKELIFPHLGGYIEGFGDKGERFNEFSQHHVDDSDSGKQYDLTIINIVKFFELARQGNPNIIDALFVPQNCILTLTSVGSMIREGRKLFLSKACWKKFKGYAYGQVKHLDNKNPVGKRKLTVDKYGFDVKFSYHVVRLLNEIEQILITHDLDLQQNNEQLKAIRRGEWTEQQVRDYFARKESELETIYLQSTLREQADEAKLKQLLLDCLEAHYGNLSEAIVCPDESLVALRDINQVLERLKSKGNRELFL
jgi:predicted nucleotidyltransferase